jgi:hypothetical protein
MRRVLLALVVAALSVPTGAGAAGSIGSLKTLVVRATHGPETFSEATVRRVVFEETDAWIREASFGQASLTGDVTPWLRVFPSIPPCRGRGAFSSYLQALAGTAEPAARDAGFDPAAYDKVVYLFPWRCPDVTGVAGSSREIGLFGALDDRLLAHELGHTFGIWVHANRWSCAGGSCVAIEYGDPYDVMGHGVGQYNAWSKAKIGWLTNVARAEAEGLYSVDQLERPSSLPQALAITTARNEYWLDHREPQLQDAFLGGLPLAEGLFVHAGPPDDAIAPSDFPQANILLPNPGGTGLDALVPGSTFSERGAFELIVVAHVGTRVDVRFRWTDRTRPTRPRLLAPRRRGGTLLVSWDPSSDRGSGLDRYELFLDGKAAASVDSDFRVGTQAAIPAARGRHVVDVVAVDRAGNRSAIARRTVLR